MVEHSRRSWLVALGAACMLLAGCGGGGAEDKSNARAEHALAAGQTVQVAARVEAPAPIETAAHSCVRQINVALKNKAPKVNADCLAGMYFGVDARGKACTLHIAASNGRFRFVERDKALVVEADAAAGAAPVYAIERADVEMGQIGLMLSRRHSGEGRDVETLELAAGQTSKGALDLAIASFSRIKAGDVTIARCFFDT